MNPYADINAPELDDLWLAETRPDRLWLWKSTATHRPSDAGGIVRHITDMDCLWAQDATSYYTAHREGDGWSAWTAGVALPPAEENS